MAQILKAQNHRVLFTAPLGQFGFYFYANFVFQQMPMFLTDVARFSPNTAGVLDILKSLVRAIASPPAGMLVDRTRPKNGVNKYVPWLRWSSVFISLSFILIFCAPLFGMTPGSLPAKAYIVVFFFLTYLSTQVFTAANVGFIPDITQDPVERSTIASARTFMREGAKVSGGLYPIVLAYYTNKFGSEMLAYFPMVTLLAAVFVLCAWICASEVKKFVPIKSTASGAGKQHQSIRLKEQLQQLLSNRALLMMFCITFCIMIRNMLDGPMAPYYFKYVVQRFELLASFNIITKVASLFSIFLAPVMVRFFGTKLTMILSGSLVAVTQGLVFFIGARYKLYILLQTVGDFFENLCATVMEVMYANASDYGEWKNGHSIPASSMALQNTAIQFSTVVAVLIRTVIFNMVGYRADIKPNPLLTKGIMSALSITCIPLLCGVALSAFIPLGDEQMRKIRQDLAQREEAYHQELSGEKTTQK